MPASGAVTRHSSAIATPATHTIRPAVVDHERHPIAFIRGTFRSTNTSCSLRVPGAERPNRSPGRRLRTTSGSATALGLKDGHAVRLSEHRAASPRVPFCNDAANGRLRFQAMSTRPGTAQRRTRTAAGGLQRPRRSPTPRDAADPALLDGTAPCEVQMALRFRRREPGCEQPRRPESVGAAAGAPRCACRTIRRAERRRQ